MGGALFILLNRSLPQIVVNLMQFEESLGM